MVNFNPSQIFYAICGGLTLGLACTLNYVIRGKDTGMTRIAYNIITLNKSNIIDLLYFRITSINVIIFWWNFNNIFIILYFIW